MENQLIKNAPQLGQNQKWHAVGYLLGKAARQCPMKFEDFSTLDFIGQSGDYYHFIADGRTILICSILFCNEK